MTLLVLNRRRIAEAIPEWLEAFGEDVILVSAANVIANDQRARLKEAYRAVHLLEAYESDEASRQIFQLCRDHGVTRILAAAEADIVRAAAIRELTGMAGQSLSSALSYRDKYMMKRIVAPHVTVAPMELASDREAIRRFAQRYGYPLILKPRFGGGSVGVTVIKNEAAAASLFDAPRDKRPALDNGTCIVEKWVGGDFFTIDGLMHDGAVLSIWASRTTANLDTVVNEAPLVSGMLAQADPIRQPIERTVRCAVAALPPSPDMMAFHAEVFMTPEGQPVLCEIACRPGGCGHVPVFEAAFGVNLYAQTLRGQAGGAAPTDLSARQPRSMAGFIWYPPRPGVLRRVPDRCDLPYTRHFRMTASLGDICRAPRSVADHVAELIVAAPPDMAVAPVLEEGTRWLDDNILID